MRPLARAAFALLLAGCNTSVTEIDVGAGELPVITISGTLGMPAAAARAGERTGTWVTPSGERVTVERRGERMFLSATTNIQFFSGEQSRMFREQLDGRARALSRIDADVQQIVLRSLSLADAPGFGGDAVLDGTVLGPNGFSARVSLSHDTRDLVVSDVEDGAPVKLTFGLQVDCAPDELEAVPGVVDINVVLQPILVIQALSTF